MIQHLRAKCGAGGQDASGAAFHLTLRKKGAAVFSFPGGISDHMSAGYACCLHGMKTGGRGAGNVARKVCPSWAYMSRWSVGKSF